MLSLSSSNISSIISGGLTPLCEIMNRHGSDKGSGHHNYTRLYSRLFESKRHLPLNILEIGIGSINPSVPSNMECGRGYIPGSSIRGWREYFPNATIYCCDIDTDTFQFLRQTPNTVPFFMDMTNVNSIQHALNTTLKDIKFDIIIDDGLHVFYENCKLMKHLLPILKETGIYIIEDIINSQYDYAVIDYASLEGKRYQYVKIENPQNSVDNNLFIVYKE
jgi:hypothetical protein